MKVRAVRTRRVNMYVVLLAAAVTGKWFYHRTDII